MKGGGRDTDIWSGISETRELSAANRSHGSRAYMLLLDLRRLGGQRGCLRLLQHAPAWSIKPETKRRQPKGRPTVKDAWP